MTWKDFIILTYVPPRLPLLLHSSYLHHLQTLLLLLEHICTFLLRVFGIALPSAWNTFPPCACVTLLPDPLQTFAQVTLLEIDHYSKITFWYSLFLLIYIFSVLFPLHKQPSKILTYLTCLSCLWCIVFIM